MDTIWRVVKNVKLENSPNYVYNYEGKSNGLYQANLISDQVKQVEEELFFELSDIAYENMTTKSLKHAAEMLIYLGTSPGSLFRPWLKFYSGTFADHRDTIFKSPLADHPGQIMLKLNRLMKASKTRNNKDYL